VGIARSLAKRLSRALSRRIDDIGGSAPVTGDGPDGDGIQLENGDFLLAENDAYLIQE
jgi:hypothetical protein